LRQQVLPVVSTPPKTEPNVGDVVVPEPGQRVLDRRLSFHVPAALFGGSQILIAVVDCLDGRRDLRLRRRRLEEPHAALGQGQRRLDLLRDGPLVGYLAERRVAIVESSRQAWPLKQQPDTHQNQHACLHGLLSLPSTLPRTCR